MHKLFQYPLEQYLFNTLSFAPVCVSGAKSFVLNLKYKPSSRAGALGSVSQVSALPESTQTWGLWKESIHSRARNEVKVQMWVKWLLLAAWHRHDISSVHYTSLYLLGGIFFGKSFYTWHIGILGSGRASHDLPVLSPVYFSQRSMSLFSAQQQAKSPTK